MARDDARPTAATTGTRPVVVPGTGDPIPALAFGPGGRQLVGGCTNGHVRVWDAATGRQVHELTGFEDPVGSVGVTADGSEVVVGAADTRTGRVWSWKLPSGEADHRYRIDAPVHLAAVAADAHVCVSASPGHLQRWVMSPAPGEPPMRSYQVTTGTPTALAATADGAEVVIGSREGELRVIDIVGAHAGAYVDCGEPIHAVAITHDGLHAFSADEDHTIRVWDSTTGEHLAALEGHEQTVEAMAVSADGTRLVSVGGDDTLRVWSLPDGTLQTTVHASLPLTTCSIAPDGGTVAAADDTGTVYVLPWAWLRSAPDHELPSGTSVGQGDRAGAETGPGSEPGFGAEAGAGAGAGPVLKTVPAGPAASVGPEAGAQGGTGPGGVTGPGGDAGADDGGDDGIHLDGRDLLLVLAEVAMADARARYREGDYRGALAALDELDGPVQRHPLFVTFHGYLTAIIGTGRKARTPQQVTPTGSFAEVDAMHFFLVGEDVHEARDHIEADRYRQAETVLDQALVHAPHFPYANFLLALAIHHGIGQRIASGESVSPDEVERRLRTAREHARIGATDPDVAGATQLLEALDQELAASARSPHVAEFNELAHEFQELMRTSGGHPPAGELLDLAQRAVALKARMTDPEGHRAIDMLLAAIAQAM